MIHTSTISACGLLYASDYPRPGRCPRCWRESHPDRTGKIASGLMWQVAFLQKQLIDARRELARRPQNSVVPIPADMHRRLLHLAHPDKHGGSPMSTEATRRLLDHRP